MAPEPLRTDSIQEATGALALAEANTLVQSAWEELAARLRIAEAEAQARLAIARAEAEARIALEVQARGLDAPRQGHAGRAWRRRDKADVLEEDSITPGPSVNPTPRDRSEIDAGPPVPLADVKTTRLIDFAEEPLPSARSTTSNDTVDAFLMRLAPVRIHSAGQSFAADVAVQSKNAQLAVRRLHA